jgi:hypothetical protein
MLFYTNTYTDSTHTVDAQIPVVEEITILLKHEETDNVIMT